MFYAVLLFRPFGRVPGAEVSCQITGDAAHTQNIFALAYRTLVEDNPFVSAVVAGIYRVVDGAVAYVLIVHHLYNFGDGAYILLGFSVQFHISDVAPPVIAWNGASRLIFSTMLIGSFTSTWNELT